MVPKEPCLLPKSNPLSKTAAIYSVQSSVLYRAPQRLQKPFQRAWTPLISECGGQSCWKRRHPGVPIIDGVGKSSLKQVQGHAHPLSLVPSRPSATRRQLEFLNRLHKCPIIHLITSWRSSKCSHKGSDHILTFRVHNWWIIYKCD